MLPGLEGYGLPEVVRSQDRHFLAVDVGVPVGMMVLGYDQHPRAGRPDLKIDDPVGQVIGQFLDLAGIGTRFGLQKARWGFLENHAMGRLESRICEQTQNAFLVLLEHEV